MILNTSAYSVPLVQAGITYNGTLGFWECASSFSFFGNNNIIHDYSVFGKLAYTSSPGAYPAGYDSALFYYGFSYVHWVPNPTSLTAPTSTFRFGLAATLEDAMERTPIIFADGGSGNLQFKTYGKFTKLVATVPECCDLPYFNERNLSLANYQGSFDPEALNYINTSYDNSVALHNQIDHDKIKKSVSFTISGITRNSFPPEPNTPYNPSLTVGQLNTEITEVIGWMNTEHTLYHNSDSPEISFWNSDTILKGWHRQQSVASAGSVPFLPGVLSYANGRSRPQTYPARYIIDRFSVTYGDLAAIAPYTPDPDKILYRLRVSGQFHVKTNYMVFQVFNLTYELKENFSTITTGHLSGTKTLTLVANPDYYYGNNYIENIPSTIDVTFSDDDYSAEVLPATLTLVSPEKHLQDPCRVATVSAVGNYYAPSGLGVVDGVTLVEGDRVLTVITSSYPSGGVWVASAGTWTRPAGYNVRHSYYEILEGTNAGKRYFLTNSLGTVYSQFGVFPSQHDWTVNNYTDELPSTITLNKVAGYNNYEAEFTTAVNVRNYIRLKLTALGFGFSFQQWTQDLIVTPSLATYYEPSDALIEYFNESTGLTDGSLLYTAPAEAKMLTTCSGLITIRLFKMAATNNGSSSASENSLTVQYLLDWPTS